jgi:hypothetical protein
MIRLLLLTTAALIALAAAGVTNAAIQNLAISGSLDGHDYTGTLSLDVNGGQAVSGTGTLSILGLNNAPIVLITASTPGASGYPNNLIGYRGNDGTDYFNLAKPTRSAPTACCSTWARPRRSRGTSRSSPSGRKGRAMPPPSSATSAGLSITTSKAARWPRRLTRCRSPPLGRCLALASLALALQAGGVARRIA